MAGWEDPDPAELVPLASPSDWTALAGRYENPNPRSFKRCIEVARANGATTAVIETRYLDQDYRSEYSAFFSRTFAEIPDTTQRIHFFGKDLDTNDLWRLPAEPGYLGYIVVRPSRLGRVGRTLLLPPADLRSAIRTSVATTVNFFGQELQVSGVPFVQQDAQFGRCAHAAAWMCHYTASLRGDASRRPLADFSLLADPDVAEGRPIPSPGLTGLQLSNLMRDFGLPPIFYRMGALPTPDPNEPPPLHNPDDHPGLWDIRAIAIACRYLNSRVPVLVGTLDHAFVLVGYRREPRPNDKDWITFIRHDDQRGPYLEVDNILADVDPSTSHVYGPWEMLLAPLPEKLWLAPEAAERAGRAYLLALSQAAVSAGQTPATRALARLDQQGHLALRTYATTAAEFKARASQRGLDSTAVQEYRLARLSRLVWVVEAIDRRRRARGQDCVLGEAVFDSTSSDYDPRELIVRVPGLCLVSQTSGLVRFPLTTTRQPCASAGPTPP